jgi:hypothetical protein
VAVVGGLAVLVGIGWTAVCAAGAEYQTQQERAASRCVSEALESEITGKNSHRDGLLKAALEEAPDHPAARWQSGYVRSGGRWVKFEELPELASQDQRLAAYRRMRDKFGDTVEAQLELARWCKRARLPEQSRAHLGHVLQLDPDHQEARALLGYKWINGTWMTDKDVERARTRAAAADAALRQWRPKLVEIRDGLENRSPKRRQIAQDRLDAIEDSRAVGAVEAVLCQREATALAGINKLAEMPAADASVSLARQALFSPWPAVRQAAVEKLKTRDRETFVPVLLSLMGSPIQSRVELYQDPGTGQILYRHIFYREGQDRDQLAVFDTTYAVDDGTGWVARLDAAGKARQREAAAARLNVMTEAASRPICRLLVETTGVNLPEAPDAWSEWWAETNEVYVPAYKPRSVVYRQDRQVMVTPSSPLISAPGGPAAHYSCLAAGTPVWTESGPVAIERIRVGDRVLAQDADSGELAYKPVLHTTIRQEAPLVRLELLDDTITTSSGHPFWIAGQGWMKARDIGPYMNFHGAAGTTPLHGSEPAGTGRVYNLIVADFHSYFVGKAVVLSHDITRRKPSDLLVPGLARR